MAIVRLNKDTICYEFDPVNPSSHLGTGGMGIVFKGRRVDTESGHVDSVAIKVLFKDLPEESIARARREASIQIEHENVIRMYGCVDVVDAEKRVTCHVISEYLDGDTLDKRSDNGEVFKEAEAVRIIKCILSGLYMIHDKGYIHRDIDPSNVMMCKNGKVKLIDFGIVKNVSNTGDVADSHEVLKKGTQVGKFIGKVFYASPEQAQGLHHETDKRSDVYSVGVLMYQLLTGRVPFDGNTVYEIIKQHIENPIIFDDKININLQHIIGKATAKSKEDRYQSVSEFIVDLERYESGASIQPPRSYKVKKEGKKSGHSWIFAAIAIFMILLAGGGAAYFHLEQNKVIGVAKNCMELGRYDKALELYEDATKLYALPSTVAEINLLREANQVFSRCRNISSNDLHLNEDLISIAERGFEDGYYYSAELCFDGILGVQDQSTAVNNLVKGVNGGNILSAYRLGKAHFEGEFDNADKDRAAEYFNVVTRELRQYDVDELSSELQYIYGMMHRYGYALNQDDAKAEYLFKRATKDNHSGALYELYLLHKKSANSGAMDYLTKAAELGYTKAEYDLAVLKIASKDYNDAVVLLKRLLDKRYAAADAQLALAYYGTAQLNKKSNKTDYTKYMELAIKTNGGNTKWSRELKNYLNPPVVVPTPVVEPEAEKKPEVKAEPEPEPESEIKPTIIW